jgi:hypothetical protein
MMPAVAWAVRCSPFFRQKFGLSKVDRWREFENLNSCLPALRASRDGVTGETAAFEPLPQKRRGGRRCIRRRRLLGVKAQASKRFRSSSNHSRSRHFVWMRRKKSASVLLCRNQSDLSDLQIGRTANGGGCLASTATPAAMSAPRARTITAPGFNITTNNH